MSAHLLPPLEFLVSPYAMSRADWEERIQEIKSAYREARRLSRADPQRSERFAEINRKLAELRDDEGVVGRPGWVESEREVRQKYRERKRRIQPIVDAIKEKIASETAGTDDCDRELWVGCDLERSVVGFDVWYRFDDDLDRDRSSGRLAELTSIMQAAAKEIAQADSEVRFHSHQTVQEKCGGDYYQYLR